jgi:hypothetical protein
MLGSVLVSTLLVVGAGSILIATPAAAATATFTRPAAWSTGYLANVTVTNDTAVATATWRVELDLPADTTVAHHWSAVLTREGPRWIFTPQSWNGDLAPGASTTFGFLTGGTGLPTRCRVDATPCDGADTEPPTAPTDLRASGSGLDVNLSWTASTDNIGVIGYMVGVVGNSPSPSLIPGTSFRTTVNQIATTFEVVAVDAAGNRSAPARVIYTTERPPTTSSSSRPPG